MKLSAEFCVQAERDVRSRSGIGAGLSGATSEMRQVASAGRRMTKSTGRRDNERGSHHGLEASQHP